MNILYTSLLVFALAALVAATPCTCSTALVATTVGTTSISEATTSTTVDMTIAITNFYGTQLSLSFAGDFVSVTSGPLRGTMGWVEHIADDSIYLLEYKEKGNVSTSRDDIKVSFILIPADIY